MVPTSGIRATVSASGTLGAVPLAHALVYVRNKRLGGVLELRAGGARHAWVAFWNGLVVSIMTSPTIARFGTVVYEMGLVDAPTLDASTRRSQEVGRTPMEVLLDMGAITPAQCDVVLAEQVRRRVHHLFTYPPSTAFTFREGRTSGTEPATLVDLLAPVWRGLRDFAGDIRATVVDVLANVGAHPMTLVSEAVLERAELSEPERDLCELLATRPRRLSELRAASPLPHDDVDLLVYFLLITRALEVEALERPAVASSALWTAVRPATSLPDYAPLETPHAPMRAVRLDAERTPAPSTSSDRLTAAGAAYAQTSNVLTPAELGDEAIVRRAAAIASETLHARLGLPEGASTEAVRAAFFRLSRAWSPARLPADREQVRAAVERIFAHMSEAHRLLTDPDLARMGNVSGRR